MVSEKMKNRSLFLVMIIFAIDVSHGLNEQCLTSKVCDVNEKSVCINGICQCDQLSNYSQGIGKCLNYATDYNTLCYEDWQCVDYIGQNSQCLNNACLCGTGYRWFQGKCQKYANKGEACNEKLPCFDGNSPLALTCTEDNVCLCSEGYYDRGEDCRVKSQEDFPCAINGDCFPTKNMFEVWTYSHCELGKCIKNPITNKTKSTEFNNTFKYSDSPSYLKRLMDEAMDDTTTASPVETCPNGVSNDLPEQDCLNCSNTLYFKQGSCICRQGFFLQDGQCMAELGMKDPSAQYEVDSDCPIKPGKVVDGVCYCRDFWFQGDTNRECKKTTLQYTQNCLDNDWCRAMGPYAYCNSQSGKCSCSSLAVLNETSFYCELNPDANVSDICLGNSACPLYETCRDEKCQCDDGFYRVNETSLCLPQIGYSCQVRDCGHIDNAICATNETCQCKSESFVSDGFVCLEKASDLYAECSIQQQCENIPHTDCINITASTSENITSQCLCTDEYLDIEGVCYAIKGPGSQCSTQFNCTIILGDTFECRNNLCQCPIGTTLHENVCTKGSSAIRSVFHPAMLVFLLVILAFKFE